MRVCVTGAAGRLAAPLLRRLAAEPEITGITGIDRRPPPDETRGLNGLRWIRHDLREPLPPEPLLGHEALVHLAFVLMGGGLGWRRHDRQLVRRINVDGTRRLIEAAWDAGVSRYLFVSSAAVYGPWPDTPQPVTETAPLRPRPGFGYAEDKAAVERWLAAFSADHPEASVVRLRPHAILGPRAHPLLRGLATAGWYPASADPAPRFQCVDEDDVVEAIGLALKHPEVSGAFNLAADPPFTLRELAHWGHPRPRPIPTGLVQRLHPLAWWLHPGAGDPGWTRGLRDSLVVDRTRAAHALGWQPRRDTRECIRRLTDPDPA